jgi:DNA-binding transcriptional LysR family regulator
LTSKPLIIRELGSGTRCALEKSLERAGGSLAELNVSLEVGSNAAIKDAVGGGIGVEFLSRLAVKRAGDAKELWAVSVRSLGLMRHLYLVYHRSRPLSRAGSAFLQLLDAHPLDPDRGGAGINKAYGLLRTYHKELGGPLTGTHPS